MERLVERLVGQWWPLLASMGQPPRGNLARPEMGPTGIRAPDHLIRSPLPVREPQKGEIVREGRSCRRRPKRFLG